MDEIKTEQQLGAALRERRERAALSQAQLAERASVSRAFITEVERGKRPRAELNRVLAVIRALDAAVLLTDIAPTTAEEALDEILGLSQ